MWNIHGTACWRSTFVKNMDQLSADYSTNILGPVQSWRMVQIAYGTFTKKLSRFENAMVFQLLALPSTVALFSTWWKFTTMRRFTSRICFYFSLILHRIFDTMSMVCMEAVTVAQFYSKTVIHRQYLHRLQVQILKQYDYNRLDPLSAASVHAFKWIQDWNVLALHSVLAAGCCNYLQAV